MDARDEDTLATLSHNAPLGIVLAIGGSLSYRAHVMLRQDRDLVVHTYQVLGTLQQMLVAVEEAEAAQRGFVITGETAFLAPYTRAKDRGGARDGKRSRAVVDAK